MKKVFNLFCTLNSNQGRMSVRVIFKDEKSYREQVSMQKFLFSIRPNSSYLDTRIDRILLKSIKTFFVILLLSSLVSCESKSQLSKDLECKPDSYSNLEVVEDVDKRFKIQLPDNWKTNLYFDKNQTSIFSADTTKQLTDTYTIDVTYIYNELKLDDDFIQRFKKNLMKNQLVESTSYELLFNEKEAYYSRALGKRGRFDYQICNLFVKINEGSYLHAKTEVYGDSLVNQRICNAISLIEKIEY